MRKERKEGEEERGREGGSNLAAFLSSLCVCVCTYVHVQHVRTLYESASKGAVAKQVTNHS